MAMIDERVLTNGAGLAKTQQAFADRHRARRGRLAMKYLRAIDDKDLCDASGDARVVRSCRG